MAGAGSSLPTVVNQMSKSHLLSMVLVAAKTELAERARAVRYDVKRIVMVAIKLGEVEV
jgi:predicted ATP-grasp superfamily ATP-dependent carboligase